MSQSTKIAPIWTTSLRTKDCPDLDIRCRALVTDSGCRFDILTIGGFNLFPSLDQLRRIRDVIDAHLADQGTDDRQAPPEQPAPLTQDEVDALPDASPDDSWAGRTDAVTLLHYPIAGGCDPSLPEPFEPTPEDWADYRAATEAADRLDQFNTVRTG
jgi:hypothetical protein